MHNTDKEQELLRLNRAASLFTNEAINKIINACSGIADDNLPAYVRNNLAEIDAECCRLLRNRLLLNQLAEYLVNNNENDKHCSFTDVYANCCRTVEAICRSAGTDFYFSDFMPECKLDLSADKCCMLILLPIALAFEHDSKTGVRLIASRKGDRIELEYSFSGNIPPVDKLVEECLKDDRSSGLFFPEPLLALSLKETAAYCNALLSLGKNSLALSLNTAESNTCVNSLPESYIDNRFSLPYIILSGIVRREI